MSNNYRELTGREKQRIKKLVTSFCANYDKEYGCLRYRGPQKVIRLFGERRSDGVSELMTFLSNKKVVTNDMESATTTLAQRVGFEPTGDCSHDGFRVHAVMTSSVPLHINLVKLFYTVFIILSILQVIIFCDKIFLLHTMEISYGCYY